MKFIIASLITTKDKSNLLNHDTLSNDTIITDILDNDISVALEKLSILSDKSNTNDVADKDSKNYSITP